MASPGHCTEAERRRASLLLHLFAAKSLAALLTDLELWNINESKESSVDAALDKMEVEGSLLKAVRRFATREDLVKFLEVSLKASHLDYQKLSRVDHDGLLDCVMDYLMNTGRYHFFDKEDLVLVKEFLTQLDTDDLNGLECKFAAQQRSSSSKAARVKNVADRLDASMRPPISIRRFLDALQDGPINILRNVMVGGDGVCSRSNCVTDILRYAFEDDAVKATIRRSNMSASKKRAPPQGYVQAGPDATSKESKLQEETLLSG